MYRPLGTTMLRIFSRVLVLSLNYQTLSVAVRTCSLFFSYLKKYESTYTSLSIIKHVYVLVVQLNCKTLSPSSHAPLGDAPTLFSCCREYIIQID